MGISTKFMVAVAVAISATPAAMRSAEAPGILFGSHRYVSNHVLNPVPVMGIRGDARVIPTPTGV